MPSRLQATILEHRRALIVGLHLLIWTASYLGAFLLRFDSRVPDAYATPTFALWVVPLLVLRTVSFARLGLFHGMWKYTGTRDLENLVKATVGSTLVMAVLILFSGMRSFPRSIPIIEALLAIAMTGGLRFGVRSLMRIAEQSSTPRPDGHKRVLIVGAGDAGELLLRELLRALSNRYQAVGFVDDAPRKQGATIHGVKVIGRIDDVPALVGSERIDQVIIAVPSASGREMRRILEVCRGADVPVSTVPGMNDLIEGSVTISQLRDVAIEDLLGRDPVHLDAARIAGVISGASVLITGAGGSIGSELCRQVCRFRPRRLILVERAENNLYEIHRELHRRFPEVDVVPALADVADEPRMSRLLGAHAPSLILHAAAHKHVPMMELNPGEAIKNNVVGTRSLARLSHEHGVRCFVMISTDKAVNPTSVMGASKRAAELCVQALASRSRTTFAVVRFGNVLGSTGSVIPLFKEQIARGGPVTVTHPDMVRYFMTIPEASQLVLEASAMAESGEIFILDMGEPVRILDLARDLIALSGLEPDEDIDIVFTGVRPGEKLFEELSIHDELAGKTRHPKIYVGRHLRVLDPEGVGRQVDELVALADGDDDDRLRAALGVLVPEFTPAAADTREREPRPTALAPVVPLRRA